MPTARALYIGQSVKLSSAPTGVGGFTGYLPVSSASCEVTKPIESINVFGHLNTAATAQVSPTTCKSSIKAYLSTGTTTGVAGVITGFSANFANLLVGNTVSGNLIEVLVSPNGFTMTGILSSVGIDMAVGGFGTVDLSFDGIGAPKFEATPTTTTATDQTSMPSTITPVTTANVGGQLTGNCVNSFKFSMDLPTEQIACLGYNPNEAQGPNMQTTIATKPPYKTSITLEGMGVDLSTDTTLESSARTYRLGDLVISLPNPKMASKSFNNAVGTIGATYNYSLQDQGVTFATGIAP